MKKLYTRTGEIVAARPNWTGEVTEEYTFQTVVGTSADGTETREALRAHPRIAVEFLSDNFGPLGRRIGADLKVWPDKGLRYLPVHWRYTKLAASANVGATVLGLDRTPPWWMTPGSSVVLEGQSTQEVREVASVGANSVTLTEPLTGAFALGDRVILAWRVRYPASSSLSSRTSQHRQSRFRFEVDPGPVDLTGLPAATGFHEGHEILLKKPNFTSPITTVFDDQRETLDFGIGVVEVDRFKTFTTHQESLTYLAKTREQADFFIGMFTRSRGQRMPFWVPTFLFDAEPVSGGAQGTYDLTLDGTDFADAYTADETYTTVTVRMPDGSYQFNRILQVSVSGQNSVIRVENPWVDGIPVGSQVAFGFFARMMSDRLVVSWVTDSVAEIVVNYKALPSGYMAPLTAPALSGATWAGSAGPTGSAYDLVRSYTPPATVGSTAITYEPGNHLLVDLHANGVPLSAVDRGLAIMSLAGTGYIGLTEVLQDLTGGNVGSGAWTVTFDAFDADDIRMAFDPDRPLDYNNTGSAHSFAGTVYLPVGTRYLRLRDNINLNSGSVIQQRLLTAFLYTRPWGLGYDIGDRQWP